MLYLIVEEEFRSYPWCQQILNGLNEEAHKKRVLLHEESTVGAIPDNDSGSAVLIVGASELWVDEIVREANCRAIHPIVLSNWQSPVQSGIHSTVTMDLQDSVCMVVDYLQSLGCRSLALYGVNPSATSDPWREQTFRALTGNADSVFRINKDYGDTFSEFRSRMDSFDGVICANDYAAVSLVRHLRAEGVDPVKRFAIVGSSDLFLGRMTVPSITSIADDYEHFGRAALMIYNLVVREKRISSVSIMLHSRLQVRETTGGRPYRSTGAPAPLSAPQSRNLFFADREISEMARLELMFSQCDKTDFAIIRYLMAGDTYADMAEKCFISETAAKYRIRKIEKTCAVEGRGQLVAFLKEFL